MLYVVSHYIISIGLYRIVHLDCMFKLHFRIYLEFFFHPQNMLLDWIVIYLAWEWFFRIGNMNAMALFHKNIIFFFVHLLHGYMGQICFPNWFFFIKLSTVMWMWLYMFTTDKIGYKHTFCFTSTHKHT